MKSKWLIMLTLGVLAVWSAGPFAQPSRADLALRAAMETETVKGDLRGAIEQYKKVVVAGDHAIAAKALLRMADCYQKLGDAEAHEVYARIVREFGDQMEVLAIARARLGAEPRAAAASGMVLRRVWSGADVDSEGMVSADGHYISFPDWQTGDQCVRDLVTSTTYHLTRHDGQPGQYAEYAEESSISPDSKQIAYSWFNGKDRYELRLIPLQLSALPQSRRLYDNEEVSWIAPHQWSPDGTSIAVQIARKDSTSVIGLISVRDGSLRVLKSIDWRGATRIIFSPDGKYLAFDLPGDERSNDDRQMFVLAVDGSRETRVPGPPGENLVMGFSPDGTRLLFGSDRSGSFGLWSVPIADGRVTGPAALLKQDIPPSAVGMTKTGALFAVARIRNVEVYVASGDVASGKVATPPAVVASRFLGANTTPIWSPDGKSLAYVSVRQLARNTRVMVVRSVETGQSRELQPALNYFGPPQWMPDSRALLVKGKDLKARSGIYRVDAQTGDVSLVSAVIDNGNAQPQMSPDGKKLYLWNSESMPGTKDSIFVERNLENGQERTLLHDKGPWWLVLSPDGRYLSGVEYDDSTRSSSLILVNVSDGGRKELMRVTQPQSLGNRVSWMPDSPAVIVYRQERGRAEHLMVSASDGTTRTLNLGVDQVTGPISVHPDGRRIAFAAGQGRAELWTLENFLPAPTSTKPR